MPADAEPCPLCLRPMRFPSRHHLVPRSEGGRRTVTVCRDCHDAVHALIPNRDLAARYADLDALRAEERVARAVAFLARRPAVTRTPTRTRRRP